MSPLPSRWDPVDSLAQYHVFAMHTGWCTSHFFPVLIQTRRRLGFACDGIGLTAPTGPCSGGYWCNIGSPASHPMCSSAACLTMFGICPVGSFCPTRTTLPTTCPSGTFTNQTGSTLCTICPPGFYCNAQISTSTPLNCPLGYFCPPGTGLNIQPCPLGTFGEKPNLRTVDECSLCSAGSFCSSTGLSSPTGKCSAGFYCPQASESSFGQTVYALNLTCPVGSYCPSGSAIPSACPPGTYNPSRGKHAITECLDCPPGSYCSLFNMSTPSGACAAGFYCSSGSSVANPSSMNVSVYTGRVGGGGVCSPGTYCPRGTAVAYTCPAGTYNNLPQQSQCRTCPGGYWCAGGVVNYMSGSYDCPRGFFCPNGTQVSTQYPCPAGSFNGKTRRRSVSDCQLSPPGYYASGTGNANSTGLCAVGFYCPQGAVSSTPTCASSYCSTGGPCRPGQECPRGTALPTPCSAGSYCATSSGVVTGLCAAGYYCTQVMFLSRKSVGRQLPHLHAC